MNKKLIIFKLLVLSILFFNQINSSSLAKFNNNLDIASFKQTALPRDLQYLIIEYLNFYCQEYGSQETAKINKLIKSPNIISNLLYGRADQLALATCDNICLIFPETAIFNTYDNKVTYLGQPQQIVYSYDGKYIALEDPNLYGIRVWNIENIKYKYEDREFKRITNNGSLISLLAFDNTNSALFIIEHTQNPKEKLLKILNISNESVIKTIPLICSAYFNNAFEFQQKFRTVALSNSCKLCATTVDSKTILSSKVKIYSIDTEQELKCFGNAPCIITRLTFSPNDKLLATFCSKEFDDKTGFTSSEKIVKIWDIETGNCINTFTALTGKELEKRINKQNPEEQETFFRMLILNFEFSRNGQFIIGTFLFPINEKYYNYYLTRIWDINSGKIIQTIEDTRTTSLSSDGINLAFALSSDVRNVDGKKINIARNQALDIINASKNNIAMQHEATSITNSSSNSSLSNVDSTQYSTTNGTNKRRADGLQNLIAKKQKTTNT